MNDCYHTNHVFCEKCEKVRNPGQPSPYSSDPSMNNPSYVVGYAAGYAAAMAVVTNNNREVVKKLEDVLVKLSPANTLYQDIKAVRLSLE